MGNPLKYYLANDGDTLVAIANRYNVEVDQLILLNPHLRDPDIKLGGCLLSIPPSTERKFDLSGIPVCPPRKIEYPMKQFIALTSLEQMAETDYDVIIVGTGAGGGAALWRLCERWRQTGKKVGVVERGPIVLQAHIANFPTLDGRFWDFFLDPLHSFPIGDFFPDMPGAREVFALGGRMLYWGLVSPRMSAFELQHLPVSAQEMETYYNIAEQQMFVSKQTEWVTPLQQAVLNRFWEKGVPQAQIAPKAINLDPARYGPVVYFSSISFLADASKLHPYDLAIHARAIRILTANKKVAGIEVMTPDKTTYSLRTKSLVISANAFETPRLLLYSGINDGPIGHYLTNHSFLDFTLRASAKPAYLPDIGNPPYMEWPAQILVPESVGKPFQLQFLRSGYSRIGQQRFELSGLSFGKVESRYENKLFLNRNRQDVYGIPEIQVDFSYSARDNEIIGEIIESIHKTADLLGFDLPPDYCLHTPGTDYHEMGTCRMGFDPATSAADPYGQIHGTEGLYIADNSVLPTTGAANPTLTTVALAIRTADYISGRTAH
ncbi:GMC oxidoreductase [Paenibacillus beijingensis]|uniref:LysM domain-containing protein n=1 Tax=Paenibacillus beijingensis TaxID=1126833 RepID=A0A0D5NL79_9BACL|nr:GMC oxidoreductase [Paenibacillus beijingensis]AJY75895.1 hypothetical protein VN24_16735 [Paenibacillus beijingensis]